MSINTKEYILLTHLNDHMNKNPSYPGDWYKLFYNYINNKQFTKELLLKDNHLLFDYNFTDIDNMIILIGEAFRSVDKKWCKEYIIGYEHSEKTKNTILSKSRYIYDEKRDKLHFWYRFLSQMLIFRYG